eukprot:5103575-Amphidinium_carterae.1
MPVFGCKLDVPCATHRDPRLPSSVEDEEQIQLVGCVRWPCKRHIKGVPLRYWDWCITLTDQSQQTELKHCAIFKWLLRGSPSMTNSGTPYCKRR